MMAKTSNKKKSRNPQRILDSLDFPHILVIWVLMCLLFGFVYCFFANDNSHLIYARTGQKVDAMADFIYFSFITATSTGFGDIVPMGYFKVISILEVVLGIIILAVVTTKLVSMKQDTIMEEIYDISFYEKINRIRSSLLLFRQNINKITIHVETFTIRKMEVKDLSTHLSMFEDSLADISEMIDLSNRKEYTKGINPMDTELIFNSINQSFEKIDELTSLMEKKKVTWKKDGTLKLLRKCLDTGDLLFELLGESGLVSEKIYMDAYLHNRKSTDNLKKLADKTKTAEEDVSA